MVIDKVLSKRALISPHRYAVFFKDQAITYLEMDQRTNRLSQGLLHHGVKRGDRVALLMQNCPQYLEAFFAIARIGAVIVPLNTRLAAAELDYILKDCGVSVLIYGEGFEEKVASLESLPNIGVQISTGKAIGTGCIHYETLLDKNEPLAPGILAEEDNLLAVMYTSGTTGYPKGVMLTHLAVYHGALNLMTGLNYQYPNKCLIIAPLFHTGASTPIIGHFIKGISTVLMEKFEPTDALKLIEQYNVRLMLGVTTIMQQLLAVPNYDDFKLHAWKIAILPGSPLPYALIEAAYERFGVLAQNLWGMTELAGPGALMNLEDILDKPECAGKPYFEVDLRIADFEGRNQPSGEKGEVLVRGPNMMLGYWNQPEATDDTIRNGWIHTGDIGYIDSDGYLYVVDRIKDMIVSGGENVYPAEIEKVLLKMPEIVECSVIGVPDEKWGEVPKAFIVPNGVRVPTDDEIIQYCRKHLAGFKTPKYIEIIATLPKNASGKVLKKSLRAHYGATPALK